MSKNSKKPEYRRESFRLNEAHLREAVALTERVVAGSVLEWRDVGTVGLTLRIIPGKAVWYLRRREITLRLADVGELSLVDARYIAKRVQLAAARQQDLKAVVAMLVESHDSSLGSDPNLAPGFEPDESETDSKLQHLIKMREAAKQAPKEPEPPFWTWKKLTDKFLEDKLPSLKEGYRKDYEHYLRLEQFRSIDGKMVRDIKIGDLERVRDAIIRDHAASAVHRAVSQGKSMLSWAWETHASASGLADTEHEWWKRWSFKYKTKERTHSPTIQEIARTLVLAEHFTHPAEGEHETYPGTLGALWGVCLTAQRTAPLVGLRPDRLFDVSSAHRKLRGWKTANWTADEMKGGKDGGRPHSLPLPPEALKILIKYHEGSGSPPKWMFTGRDPDKHVSQSALNLLMYRLQGRVWDHTKKQKPGRKGKPGPTPRPKKERPDLFAIYGIRPWTLHDCRRAITDLLDDKRLGGAASAILGHKTTNARMSERERLAPVTEQHYSNSQRIGLKADGMKIWVNALLKAYEKERRQFRDLLRDRKAA